MIGPRDGVFYVQHRTNRPSELSEVLDLDAAHTIRGDPQGETTAHLSQLYSDELKALFFHDGLEDLEDLALL